ncbi:DUF4262 domain-containing protein [Microbacterium sp. EYE_5]|uniref:DUF4262 domain-containing protein n=1 Tax=unclassified Microbacterium TaxID=2609290 RepID=UPI002005B210|nr:MULTISPECIES: DUF4262 domain-containing protein [unclassified Microbacterium]MCK6079732.1 DUF4262 domain-containing protein [Microbacterium sp. EYE_382]MCK6085003.1 DUF4262 domain-containing protein [Microbacterium sp. EYE_384]MCK6122771.1 DUF4262 domain-containing protein [Microbacterium sp. EYE_80]MCK6125766.1 DUF4262 domain-containing protein [Microbacterium sp. EYE_79]MCK6140687.1 DUF4262 domain-containing protein [Microbacterium sp. EYE_39]
MDRTRLAAWLDEESAYTAAVIRDHGVFIQYVGGMLESAAPFAYTVGLFGSGRPEIAIVGVSPGTAAAVLNTVAKRVIAGEELRPGQIIGFGEEWPHRVRVEQVPNPGDIAYSANDHYRRAPGSSVPLLQLTYDDKGGRFPDEDGYANPGWVQPRPGRWRA